MTIQELGSIGELIAAIATVATLAYLAAQIRGARQVMRAESRRAGNRENTLLAIASDKGLADVFNRGLTDLSCLDAAEHTQFTMLLASLIGTLETTFDEHRLGLDAEDRLTEIQGRLSFLRTPGGRAWWQRNRDVFPREFGAWLTQYVEEGQDGSV